MNMYNKFWNIYDVLINFFTLGEIHSFISYIFFSNKKKSSIFFNIQNALLSPPFFFCEKGLFFIM